MTGNLYFCQGASIRLDINLIVHYIVTSLRNNSYKNCQMPSKVIRIDEEVWAYLQGQATALEDTPNSVMRRMIGLPAKGTSAGILDLRVGHLVELVQDSLVQKVQTEPNERGCLLRGENGTVVAHIRPQKERIRVAVRKRVADRAGLDDWDKKRRDRFFGGTSVRWFIQDDDEPAYARVADILAKLWAKEDL